MQISELTEQRDTALRRADRSEAARQQLDIQGFEICQLSCKWRPSDPKKFVRLRLANAQNNAGTGASFQCIHTKERADFICAGGQSADSAQGAFCELARQPNRRMTPQIRRLPWQPA